MSEQQWNRREVLRSAAAAAAAVGISRLGVAAEHGDDGDGGGAGQVPRRRLGDTDARVSVIGVGGWHLGSIAEDQTAIRLVRTALDAGVNFLDNAWEYHGGRSERLMGKALRDGYRDKAFVMTKIHGRDAKSAAAQLDESLRRLGTDRVDLLQIHEVIYPDDPARVFADDGMLSVLRKAKADGKARFIGFTGHKAPVLHREMLDHDVPWDAVQLPINLLDPHFHSFRRFVVPILRQRKIGVIGMKSLCGGHLVKSRFSPAQAIRFALSQPIDVLVSGMDSLEILHKNIAIATAFQPMSEDEQQTLLDQSAPLARKGQYETFKTSWEFDGGHGRKLHGLPVDG